MGIILMSLYSLLAKWLIQSRLTTLLTNLIARRRAKCLNTLFLLSGYIWFIISFICDLFAAHNNPWMN